MRNITKLLFVLCSISCYGQINTDSINDRVGYLVQKNNEETITEIEKKELRSIGYQIQNKGFISVEKFQDYKNALTPIDSAISFWTLTKDIANEANLRKYKGMILGHLNRFEEGKYEINKAINLFESLNIDFGVAVSKYDMSQLLDLEGNIDSALIYQLEATDFWTSKKDTFRIIANNNQLIHLYCRKGLYQKAELIQNMNELILKPDLHWNPKINFYYVSYELFTLLSNENKADLYKDLYFEKLQILEKDENIRTKSIYDRE